MKLVKALLIFIISLVFIECRDKDEVKLQEKIKEEYSNTTPIKQLSSGSKQQYIQMEEAINRKYVQDLDSIINTYFDRQLKKFEDHELGVWNSYMNMFSWFFKSKDSWNEEINLISKKYFNNLDNIQEQNKLYIKYTNQIKGLRRQFLKSINLPKYQQIDITSEEISLGNFAEHAQHNAMIEILGEFLGSKLFSGLLALFITWLVAFIGGLPFLIPGWVWSLIATIIAIIVSVILTVRNDSKLIDNLREQHEEVMNVDNIQLLDELNQNTFKFYENL